MTTAIAPISICPQCGAQVAPSLLACPACASMVYASRLRALAERAQAATDRGDIPDALAAWREAIQLLPRESRQFAVITSTIRKLSESGSGTSGVPARPHDGQNSAGKKAAAGLGAAGLLLWKLKVVVLLVLTKGKLLLLGLTKASTILSMILSLGVYWTAFGWQFALGLVLSIYVHEMGHVVVLRRYGFKAGAPLFLPGLGAVILLKQQTTNPHEDAAIGLAGPIYGLGAAVAALALWFVTKQPVLGAIATIGAWINLFNLLPVWTLDGGRAFRALSRNQRWLAALAAGASYLLVHDGMLMLLLVVIAGRALTEKDAGPGDRRAATQYVFLVVALSIICLLRTAVGLQMKS